MDQGGRTEALSRLVDLFQQVALRIKHQLLDGRDPDVTFRLEPNESVGKYPHSGLPAQTTLLLKNTPKHHMLLGQT